MNPEDYSREDLLTASVATPWLVVGLLLALVIWFGSLRLRGRIATRGGRVTAGVFGAIILSAAFWLAFQLAGRWLSLATSWPLWFVAVLGGAAAESIVGIYRLERTLVGSVARGRWLMGLRLASLVILILILLQPVRSFLVDREINREVVVLIDDSNSMQLSDQRLTASEMLDRAELFNVPAVAKRPPLSALARDLTSLRSGVSVERAAYDGVPDPAAVLESRSEQVTEKLDEAEAKLASLVSAFAGVSGQPGLSNELKQSVEDLRNRLATSTGEALKKARQEALAKKAPEFLSQLEGAVGQVDDVAARLPALRDAMDGFYLEKLSEEERKTVVEAAGKPRAEIATALLTRNLGPVIPEAEAKEGQVADSTLLSRIGDRYNLRYYRFARDPVEVADAEAVFATAESTDGQDDEAVKVSGERTVTDLNAALEQILENSSPESLAGVLLLTDGRHNGAQLPEDALRQLGVQNSPLSAVPIGGRLGPVDVSILNLTAPESIYLGDRVGVKAEVKFDGLRGQEVKAVLRYGGEIVDEQTIKVPDVDYRTELRFAHLPEEKGINDYQLELIPLESELFDSNNAWSFKTAVTDDRTNVLLVDGFPRWEFRYLRNLFYGRDKSVHLQYVLLRPDRIEGVRQQSDVAASATRPFGEAEAQSLPKDLDEWKLFDVIILGDIPPAAISAQEWNAIREAVTERGALLVCIGGPRYMPHAHESRVLQDLLPVTWEPSDEPEFESPDKAFRIALTTAGRTHPVMAQSTSRSLNAQLWAQMPPATWRSTMTGVKEGAEVLAYADSLEGGSGAGAVSLDGSPESVEKAIEQLSNQKAFEQERALVTVQRAGLGKVVMLNFDQTWRFRYGVGDTYHHRFWGQLVRWGAGENLRSGGEKVRLGTDRITYTPLDPVEIIAKVLDADRRPVTDADLSAVVYQDGVAVMKQKMSYRQASSGVYETIIASLPRPGDYTVRLEGEVVDAALTSDNAEGLEHIETNLVVVSARNSVELAELTADRDFLNHAAQVTGGKVAEIGDAETLIESFGAPKETLTERRNITLWDQWPLLVLFLALLTTEWVLRRRSGLA
ncbi:MAG: hypothetical protein KDN20_06010 [Verrucomicrobiae bacterium]|nr:hypothetical protein [Verrucomicrobiae bacterium]